MLTDRNGRELKMGDVVMIPAVVVETFDDRLSPGVGNVTLQVALAAEPEFLGERPEIHLHSSQVLFAAEPEEGESIEDAISAVG